MKIEDCSKAELVYLIQLRDIFRFNDIDIDVLMFRSEEASKKSYEESVQANTAIKKYNDLLKPYVGKTIDSIPKDVIRTASEAQEQYVIHIKKSEHFNKQYSKLSAQIDKALNKVNLCEVTVDE